MVFKDRMLTGELLRNNIWEIRFCNVVFNVLSFRYFLQPQKHITHVLLWLLNTCYGTVFKRPSYLSQTIPKEKNLNKGQFRIFKIIK